MKRLLPTASSGSRACRLLAITSSFALAAGLGGCLPEALAQEAELSDAGVSLEPDAAPSGDASDAGEPLDGGVAGVALDGGSDPLLSEAEGGVDGGALLLAPLEPPPFVGPGPGWWPGGWWSPVDEAPKEEPVAARPAEAAPPSFIQIPVETTHAVDAWLRSFEKLVPAAGADRGQAIFFFLILSVVSWLLTILLRSWRRALPETGLIPWLLAVLHAAFRVIFFVALVILGASLLPPRLGAVLPVILFGAAIALGWSLRDVLPDVVASIVLIAERRVRRGEWLKGDGFSGIVVQFGIRSIVLKDLRGYRVVVPNRNLLRETVVSHSATAAEREVSLRIETDASSKAVRHALRDAILFSPWVATGLEPIVLRDPIDPQLWHIRARLLDLSYASRFSGDLLERVEENLEELRAGESEKRAGREA